MNFVKVVCPLTGAFVLEPVPEPKAPVEVWRKKYSREGRELLPLVRVK